MQTVFTIGATKKPLERFIRLLQQAGVDAVIDVRLRNTSHLAGFSKRDDLAFLLREGFSIAYEHHPELAPSQDIFNAYRASGDWEAYTQGYLAGLDLVRPAPGALLLGAYRSPCLLCAEPAPDRCHRRLIAESWALQTPELAVVHLR